MTVGDKQDIQLISYSADCNGKSRIVVVVLSCCCCAQLLLLCSVRVWSVAERVCLFNLHHPEEVSISGCAFEWHHSRCVMAFCFSCCGCAGAIVLADNQYL